MEALSNNIIKLKAQFEDIVKLQQSCKLYVTDITANSWSFYFKNGSLLWATASYHRVRRVNRLINKHYPQINCEEIKLREQEISELREYLLISVLNKRSNISQAKAIEIIKELAQEVLFDCFLAHNKIGQIKSIFETAANRMGSILRSPLFKQPIVYLDTSQVVSQATNQYDSWVKAGLADYSPNLAPVIKNSEKLQQEVDADVYSKLSVLIDGKKTLQDIAIITNQELLSATCSLMAHLRSKSLELISVEDAQLANLYFSSRQNAVNQAMATDNPNRDYVRESSLPLIVCVDDQPQVCQQIAQVLNPAGYRLIPVNESVHALSILLENKPDLVFLDLIMPIANGYEICSQIRRISEFKTIPIVILTEKDSIIDRMRAKMVGATALVSKPIDEREILAIAQKYVQGVISDETKLSYN
ncbi:response regulator [Pleurocapsales cyanobacterium LEGE 10410]|nr:response regulator [Pleurocapsales cyanobacterium LEGE 10410]